MLLFSSGSPTGLVLSLERTSPWIRRLGEGTRAGNRPAGCKWPRRLRRAYILKVYLPTSGLLKRSILVGFSWRRLLLSDHSASIRFAMVLPRGWLRGEGADNASGFWEGPGIQNSERGFIMPSRKYLIWFNTFFCIFMSAIFCLCMPLCSGAPTVPLLGPQGFLVSFAISFVVSMLVSNLLPVGKWGSIMAMKYGAKPGSLGSNLITAMFVGFIMMAALALTMIAYATGIGVIEGATLFDRFVMGLIQFAPLVLVVVFFLYPICTAIAEAIVKPADRYAGMPARHGGDASIEG